MKIAVIMNSLHYGGAESQTVEMVNGLARNGHETVLFSLASDTDMVKRISDSVDIVVIGKRYFLDPVALFRLVVRLRGIKPDRLVLVNCYSMMYGYLAHFFLPEKTVKITTQHTTIPGDSLSKAKNLVYKRIMNRMEVVVFVCNAQKEYWVEKYRIKPEITRVIYNGIDFEKFADYAADTGIVRKSLGFSADDVVIGMNALLRPEKKHEDMIDALEMFVAREYRVKLLLIGDGARRRFIEEYAESRKLCGRIAITGFVEDVRPYLSCIDISALTSTAVETFSMAVLESMAMGKPIVMSDIGGAAELVVHGENGLLYRAGDVHGLFKAIKHIIDGNLYGVMGIKSRERAKQYFSRDGMVEKYNEVLKE